MAKDGSVLRMLDELWDWLWLLLEYTLLDFSYFFSYILDNFPEISLFLYLSMAFML